MTAEAASTAAHTPGFAGRYPLLHAVFVDPSRQTILVCAGAALLLYAVIFTKAVMISEDMVLPGISVLGGDFIAFWIAAKTLVAEGVGVLYQPDVLNQRLDAAFPARGGFQLFWQYPPTFYFIIAPLSLMSYPVGLASWMAATTTIAAAAFHSLWRVRLPILAAFASAAAWQAWICGQTGFLTAALIAVAGGFADRRPIIAGIAAGLLTVKPQLGLLIPIAFIAAGCWRAFGAAAVTAIVMAVMSVFVFGLESWVGFFDAMGAHGARLGLTIFPYFKLVTPYGFLMTFGAPSWFAIGVQGIATVALAGFVFFVWRKSPSWETRLIALSSATLIASPYAFYYEAPVFFPALLMLAKGGIERGWLKYEKHTLMAVWALPVFTPGPENFPAAALIAFAAFAVCARRALHECGVEMPKLKTASASPSNI